MILDTNSALADGEPELESVLRRAAQVSMPVIVLGEYRYGVSQSRNHIHAMAPEYLPTFRILASGTGFRRIFLSSNLTSALETATGAGAAVQHTVNSSSHASTSPRSVLDRQLAVPYL